MKGYNICFTFSNVAPAGYYLALRVGFAFPVFEENVLPKEWVKTYTSQGFMLYDPLMRWVYDNTGATRWSDINTDDPREVLKQAAQHSLNFGAVISFQDDDQTGQRSFGTFARSDREFTDEEILFLQSRIQQMHIESIPPTNLTNAEKEVLVMVKNGMFLKEIAASLSVSEGAIKQRLKNAKNKLKAKNSTQAAAMALEYGLI